MQNDRQAVAGNGLAGDLGVMAGGFQTGIGFEGKEQYLVEV